MKIRHIDVELEAYELDQFFQICEANDLRHERIWGQEPHACYRVYVPHTDFAPQALQNALETLFG